MLLWVVPLPGSRLHMSGSMAFDCPLFFCSIPCTYIITRAVPVPAGMSVFATWGAVGSGLVGTFSHAVLVCAGAACVLFFGAVHRHVVPPMAF
jgi:hypothetical protein